ncbi:glyoxalase domain-containing protein 4 [Chrysoperla carnea]|uniref:glyoxalase domain-containing protein 4 n=1 Tax=Chrysoperla carnea TaxID=189513 RepID=UPI001D07B17A|nr:glyoxalase domain-containing protein 4 [Chrysoperla carnea]
MVNARALHFVFKIADRKLTSKFYREILGMKVLRHEEFTEGCEATCNGPYAGRWSKTMVGYGPEDTHFAVELTYNYGVEGYDIGNDFMGITIKSKEALERAKANDWPINNGNTLIAPDGYKFFILDEPQPQNADPVQKVTLASSSLKNTIEYWNKILGLKIFNETPKSVELGFADNQAKLEFIDIGTEVNHAKAYGRIAFACSDEDQETINNAIQKANHKILTPLISLDTPGKATVRVIILADPDGHEICFVNDGPFRELSQVDPKGTELLDRYISKDKSRE